MSNAIQITRRVLLVTLACYWLLLAIGTHVPGQFIVRVGLMNDKFLHCCAFTGLAFLFSWCHLRRRPSTRQAVVVLTVILVYAALDEFTQGWIPSRTADFKDWVADACGAILGLTAYFVSFSIIRMWTAAADCSWQVTSKPANDVA